MVTATALSDYLADPDVMLMLSVRDGDEAAFAELWARYRHRVTSFLTYLLGRKHPVEDLVQEVFLRVYRARASYEPRARFATWLFKIANNVASNSRRWRSVRKEIPLSSVRPEEQAHLLALEDDRRAPSAPVDQSELRAIIDAAMDDLNARQRRAMQLHRFRGLSYDDIAGEMELSAKAVKSLLCRARDNLRLSLADYVQAQ